MINLNEFSIFCGLLSSVKNQQKYEVEILIQVKYNYLINSLELNLLFHKMVKLSKMYT